MIQGAEATILFEDDVVVKQRKPKGYRHPMLDDSLRKSRTRHEAKILEKMQPLGFTPKLIEKGEDTLKIGFIKGKLVKDILNEGIAREIGRNIAQMHNLNVIHGDLTTSNMIYNEKLYIIDFGLSYVSLKIEDKAVDLHILDRALESKHSEIYPEVFQAMLEEYRKHAKDAKDIIKRFEEVKKRGRYKHKI